MIIINILGGGTTNYCELELYSDNFKATSKYNKNYKLEIKVEPSEIDIKNKYAKIPFIRGLYIYLFQNVTTSKKSRKFKLNGFNLIAMVIYILDKFYLKISLMDYVYVLFTLLYFIIALANKRMIELHGAEHMIGNYYDKCHKVDLNDINEIKKTSIIHERCSSNYFIMKIVILFSLKIFINDFMIRFILMISLKQEIISERDNNKIIYYLTYPLYSIGMLTQRIIFVRYPKDKDIEQAIKTILELEKYENNKLS